jgi:hypothetical protein
VWVFVFGCPRKIADYVDRILSNPLELVHDPQNPNHLPQVVGYWLAPCNDLDGSLLDGAL